MRHRCEHCSTLWEIPDVCVNGKRLKIRCKSCSKTMWVLGPGASLAPPPLPPRGPYWYISGGKAQGPITGANLLSLAMQRQIKARTYVYHEQLGAWQRVIESPALRWLYDTILATNIREGWSHDELFTRAALITDGEGYFPDPTLKSGLLLLDRAAQQQLNSLARRNGLVERPHRATRWVSRVAAAAAAVVLGLGIGTAAQRLGVGDGLRPLSSMVSTAYHRVVR